MPRFEVLECPRLPRGYSLRITIERDQLTRSWAHAVSFGTPATGSVNLTPGSAHRSRSWPTRATALEAAASITVQHLNARRAIHPAAVRNIITTWLNTLTAPAENEQQLF